MPEKNLSGRSPTEGWGGQHRRGSPDGKMQDPSWSSSSSSSSNSNSNFGDSNRRGFHCDTGVPSEALQRSKIEDEDEFEDELLTVNSPAKRWRQTILWRIDDR